MKRIVSYVLLAALLPLSFSSCDGDNKGNDGTEKLVNLLPDTRAVQLTADQKKLVEANNDFAFKLFSQIYSSKVREGRYENVVSSPLGIAYMLGMLNAGAEGTTKSEMLNFLGFEGSADKDINAYFSALLKQLPEADRNVTLLTANALYLNKNYSFNASYLETMKKDFDAQLETVDFGKQAEVLNKINGWTNEKTKGMIPAIMDKADPGTVACLLNALYFKGNWTSRFDAKRTEDAPFTKLDGEKATVPMMHNNVAISAAQCDDYAMVNIPFGNGLAWHMYVLLPNGSKTVADVLRGLNNESWTKTLHSQRTMEMDLKMPRFKTDSELDMKPVLQGCGVREVFTNGSQLSKICDNSKLKISKMKQKVAFGVDEDGVKMTTVTVSELRESSAHFGYDSGTFYADSPFVYVISEASSGVILAMGVYQGN